MQKSQSRLSDQDFYRELINRFFHHRSYFYRCVKRELGALLRAGDSGNRRAYQLCDGLLEKLVVSGNKTATLRSLEAIPGFNAFTEKISEGVKLLREAELDAEKMKIQIEALSQSLIRIAVQALFTPETAIRLDRFLDPESGSSPAALPVDDLLSIDTPSEVEEFGIEPIVDSGPTGPAAALGNELFLGDETISIDQTTSQATVDSGIATNEQISVGDDSTIILEEFDEIPLTLDEEISGVKLGELIESPLDESGYSEPETASESSLDSLTATDEEKDFLLTVDDSMDAAHEGGCEIDPGDEGDSINSLAEAEPARGSADSFSVTGVFESGMRSQMEALQSVLQALGQNPRHRKSWNECGRVFEGIAAKAMVCGFEGFEEIAGKAQAFVVFVLRNLAKFATPGVCLLSETKEIMTSMLTQDVDNVDKAVVAELSQKLQNPGKSLKRVAVEPETPSASRKESPEMPETAEELREAAPELREEEISGHVDDSQVEDLLPKLGDSAPVEEFASHPHDDEKSNFEISNFKLPGEDDEEIVSLVNEISMNADDYEDFDELEDLTPLLEPEGGPTVVEDVPESQPTSSIPDPSPADVAPPKAAAITDDKLSVFMEQSEFYFNIMDEALAKLEAEPGDKISLEDIELSCHSLFELSIKLNLEPISEYPRLIEELATKIISKDGTLSSNDHKLVSNVYNYFRNLDGVDKASSDQAQTLLAELRGLGAGLSGQSRPTEASLEIV